jgi:flagellum-specific ATP synthase
MHEIASPAQVELARRFRQTLSTYQHHRDLIAIGAYQRGTDPRVDAAMALWPRMQKFLQQGIQERTGLAQSLAALEAVLRESPEAAAADTKVST